MSPSCPTATVFAISATTTPRSGPTGTLLLGATPGADARQASPAPGRTEGPRGGGYKSVAADSCAARCRLVWTSLPTARAESGGRFVTVQQWRNTRVRTEAVDDKLPQRFFVWGDREAAARERTTPNDEEVAADAQWQGTKIRTAASGMCKFIVVPRRGGVRAQPGVPPPPRRSSDRFLSAQREKTLPKCYFSTLVDECMLPNHGPFH